MLAAMKAAMAATGGHIRKDNWARATLKGHQC